MTQLLQAKPDLGDRILAAERQRASRWRIEFLAVWLVILAGLIAFVLITIKLDAAFLTKVVPFIVGGVGVTLLISLSSIALAIILAALGALGRLSRNPVANGVASFYVSLVRGTPLLLQILFIYLALPQAGLVLDAFVCGGQAEAADSLGMSGRTTFFRIIAPQAFRIVTPAIGNDFIAMLKDSSLVSAIGVHEILFNAQVAGRPTFQSMQTLIIAALVYWVMTITFSYFQNRLERRMATADRAKGAV
jgi:polar amino acid transport system permease protein